MKDKNSISIITVAFNSEKTIKETLESVRNQITKPNQYIIVDGGSTDMTLSILQDYSDIITDIISEKDDGIYDAMNKGLSLVNCDIVGFLNSDDTYIDKYVLDRVKSSFEEGVKIFCGGINYVDSSGFIKREWLLRDSRNNIQGGWHPPHPGFFCKNSLYQKLGNFNLDYKIAADFDLMIRFILSNMTEIKIYPYPLVNMKLGGASNVSLKNILIGNKDVRTSLKSLGFNVGFFYTIRRMFSKLIQKSKS